MTQVFSSLLLYIYKKHEEHSYARMLWLNAYCICKCMAVGMSIKIALHLSADWLQNLVKL